MSIENSFLIPFVGLKLGKHKFEYQIIKDFFNSFNYDDFNNIDAKAVVLLNKKNTHLELSFSFEGSVNVPCDVTADDFDMPIEGELELIVKFGDKLDTDNEEYIVIPFNEFQIDISQYIYEMIVLSIPQKRVHPDLEDDDLDFEALDFLEDEDYENEENEIENNKNNDTDPRWDQLKKLLTDK